MSSRIVLRNAARGMSLRTLASSPAMLTARAIATPAPALSRATALRHFSASCAVQKKASSRGKDKSSDKSSRSHTDTSSAADAETAVSIDEIVNLAELQKAMDATVDHFRARAATVRQGPYTPAVLEAIMVQTSTHAHEPVRNIARVAAKGPRTLTITAFDAADVKHIVAAVLGADLNLNPQPDPKQEQVLRVPLPPSTSESKKEIVKNLKHEYEHYKNSPTKKSLTSLRADAMKALKKATGSKSDLFAVKTKVEDIFKAKCTTLADALKQAEAATLKE